MMRWSPTAGAVVLLAALLGGPLVGLADAQEAIYLIRHAERASDEKTSLLSEDGHVRAARLADVLRDAGITHIFVSEYQRTAQTVEPLAARLGVTPRVVPADERGALLAAIRAAGPKARILVSGHSDTVPDLLMMMGCRPPVTIAKAEFDNLFVVVPQAQGAPRCIRLRY